MSSTSPGRVRINPSVLAAITLWAGTSVAAKFTFDSFSPVAMNSFRVLFGIPLLLLVVPASDLKSLRRPIPQRRLLLLAAVSSIVGQYCWALGLQLIPASDSVMLYTTAPIWTACLAAAMGQDRLRRSVAAGIAVAFVGVVLIVGPRPGTAPAQILGDAITLLGTVCLAATSTLIARVARYYGPLACTGGLGIFAAAASLPVAFVTAGQVNWGTVSLNAWLGLGYGVLAGFVFGQILWYRGVQQIGSTQTMIYIYLQPAIGVALAVVLLGERLDAVQVAGAVIVLFGIALAQGRLGRARLPAASSGECATPTSPGPRAG